MVFVILILLMDVKLFYAPQTRPHIIENAGSITKAVVF